LALRGITADTGIHNPVIICLLNKMLYHLRWQYHLIRPINGYIQRNYPVFGQVNYVVTGKKTAVNRRANQWQSGQFGG
jgi:hypothetical protein